MDNYEVRLTSFVDHGWVPRGHAQPESLATYGFYINPFVRGNSGEPRGGTRVAMCIGCRQKYGEVNYDDHWIVYHDENCRFREAALREDLFAQFAVRQEQKLLEKNEVIDAFHELMNAVSEEIQALKRQVDALEAQNQVLEKKMEETQEALEKAVEEYAAVKTALRAALGL
ncbi:hypothetical protein KVR01_012557 [Diaporthe batatas]|uniref:uncharacterized protein n=1 Tax=Diaporthe batatas TaxID=748121 RepID=UPI001D05A86B|nr:uncharacterized protein KVR01_012557 [Diaporthe batatas]KAG8157515.1 hypothetical protein KVR01_012557 [Diaporthe batatas]